MKTITREVWKYKIELSDDNWLEIPRFYKVLDFQMQDGVLCLWVMVYPNEEKLKVRFHLVGTGHPFDPEAHEYVGTVQDRGFVWHLFDVGTAQAEADSQKEIAEFTNDWIIENMND